MNSLKAIADLLRTLARTLRRQASADGSTSGRDIAAVADELDALAGKLEGFAAKHGAR